MIQFFIDHWAAISGAASLILGVMVRYLPTWLMIWREKRAIRQQEKTREQIERDQQKAEYSSREREMLRRLDEKDAALTKILTNHISHLESALSDNQVATRAATAFYERMGVNVEQIRKDLAEAKDLLQDAAKDMAHLKGHLGA